MALAAIDKPRAPGTGFISTGHTEISTVQCHMCSLILTGQHFLNFFLSTANDTGKMELKMSIFDKATPCGFLLSTHFP